MAVDHPESSALPGGEDDIRDDQALLHDIQQTSAEMDVHRVATQRLTIRRGRAVAELGRRRSVTWIADHLGVTRQQVYRLLREALGRDYRPEDHE